MTTGTRWAWAEIDLGALDHNLGVIAEVVAPAAVWAVVKADGYGHGATAVAGQALRSGAAGLCVALVQEGVALRDDGVDAPILVLSEQAPAQVPAMIAADLVPTVYSTRYADVVAAAQHALRPGETRDVHLKFDTGMRRVGAQPSEALGLLTHVRGLAPALRVGGVFTHLACADEPAAESNAAQLAEFDSLLDMLRRAGLDPPTVHAANSAAALALPASRYDLVRTGIAMYGISPGPGVDHLAARLRPVLSLRARVSHLKRVSAGDGISYGLRHRFDVSTTVATLPIGYADGVPRLLGTLPDRRGADVLIRGRRRPIVGVVTMDQVMVDVGDHGLTPDGSSHGSSEVEVGDEAVLIGRQGDQVIRAEDWADRLGTIGYEIVCGISGRVPRLVHPSPGAAS